MLSNLRKSFPVALVLVFAGYVFAGQGGSSFKGELAKINRQCPDGYPEVVAVMPEVSGFSVKSDSELIVMLENWNPALRGSVGKEFERRGDKSVPMLQKALQSENWQVRSGAAGALSNIIGVGRSNWKEKYPNAANHGEANKIIKKKYAFLIDDLLVLLKDKQRDVRAGALGALASMRSGEEKVAMAVLRMTKDKDEYLADTAMILLEKNIGVKSLKTEVIVKGFKRAMKNPLPRGKEHIVRLIKRQDDKTQRKFIPTLLEHIDWEAGRDTMFAASGKKGALEILTKLKEPKLIPMLPRLLDRKMRGLDMFEPAAESIKAFGASAKPIMGELRTYMERLEKEKEKAKQNRDKRRSDNAVKDIEKKQAKLREAIESIGK